MMLLAYQDSMTDFSKYNTSRNIEKKKRSRVKYARSCSVILIPCRKEYVDAGIDLWYSRNDQAAAQNQVKVELKTLLDFNPILTIRSAMNFLYQPKIEDVSKCLLDSQLRVLLIDRGHLHVSDSSVMTALENNSCKCRAVSSMHDAVAVISSNSCSFNVALIDESICICDQDDMNTVISAALLQLQNHWKEPTTLFGLLIANDEDCEEKRCHGVSVGFDFIWPKPIDESCQMLHLMMAEKSKKQQTGRNSFSAAAAAAAAAAVKTVSKSDSSVCEDIAPMSSNQLPRLRHKELENVN
jgi:hypothetical protein